MIIKISKEREMTEEKTATNNVRRINNTTKGTRLELHLLLLVIN